MSLPHRPDGYLTYTAEDGTVSQIPWTAPRDSAPPQLPLAQPTKPKKPLTPANEIWQLVQDYSAAYGIPISPADAQACLAAIAEERAAAGRPPSPPPPPRTVEEALGPRPMWGDPLFWDYWRKAKALGFVNEKKAKKK
jgi:hypothetical protein